MSCIFKRFCINILKRKKKKKNKSGELGNTENELDLSTITKHDKTQNTNCLIDSESTSKQINQPAKPSTSNYNTQPTPKIMDSKRKSAFISKLMES